MAFPHLSQKRLRHLCNYFGDTLRNHSSDSISIHCTVNLKLMFAAYSNGNLFWVQDENMRTEETCGYDVVWRNIILCMPNLPMQYRIMSSLSCSWSERQISPHNIKDFSHQANRSPNRLTDSHMNSQELLASVRLEQHNASVPSSQQTY